MGKLKGDASCHTYSKQGAEHHQAMHWESNKPGKCIHRRLIGKDSLCICSGKLDCPQIGNEVVSKCPVNNYTPKGGMGTHPGKKVYSVPVLERLIAHGENHA